MGTYAKFALIKADSIKPEDIKSTEDINFYGYKDGELFQSYYLFSWLSDIRYGVKPAFNRSEAFGKGYDLFKHYDKICEKELIADDPPGTNYGFGGPPSSDIKQEIGFYRDYSCYVYSLEELEAFNYDQVAMMQDDTAKPPYPEPNGDTYRVLFGDMWFDLLKEAKEKGCKFIIVGYD